MNVYDFDNTILRGDSSVRFYTYCLLRTPRMLLRLPRLLYGALFVLRRDKQRFKQDMFAFLRDIDDPQAAVARFWDKNIRRVKPFYLAQKRDTDVIISASPEFLIAPAMARLGAMRVLASPVDIHTGLYHGKNCHGQEKVRIFRAEYPDACVDAFYSDSHSDDPMAALARSAYLVKGEKLLPWDGARD
ncbi:MAG: haloacid dehalogenase-like hydrolase [Clostridia bacterium]|nr:haloacid dehalogenase-like hydrolase [Clostridia bacterium]